VVFESTAALTSNAVKHGAIPSLYEWAAGQLQLASVLPNGKPADTEGGERASLGSLEEREPELFRVGRVRHAVSDDGSRIVWNTGQEGPRGHLYMRDMARGETVQLDAAQGAPEPAGGEAVFQIASSKGSRVFFADDQKLTANSTANGRGQENLYVFEVTSGSGEPLAGKLTDLTAVAPNSGNVVLGASEDGSYVYTTAGFLLHDTGTEWTGMLISGEVRDEGSQHEGHARVSPSGRYMAFESENGVDLYDASTGRVVCASCSPTGEHQEEGESRLPAWTENGNGRRYGVYQSRYLSDSGRLFFETSAALVPQDTNGQKDVYEYEPQGVGSCESVSKTFSEASGGCIGLISSGTSKEVSTFLDASESGNDVFFRTTQRLASQDYDTAFDVYDAHVCGASSPCFTEPVAPPACTTADSCKPASSPQPPIFGVSGSATFSGAGNIAPAAAKPAVKPKAKTKPCKKGYVKKKGKCVKSKSKKKAKKAKKASRDRRGK
jgi:hypothetical protein